MTNQGDGEAQAFSSAEMAQRIVGGPPIVNMGPGDDLDVAAGRCCPMCRHTLTEHNTAVWNAGYAIGVRHTRDEVRDAWEAGFTACAQEHMRQQRDPSYPIRRSNPHDEPPHDHDCSMHTCWREQP